MDDLLVGGTDDEEHLKNLEAVFKQFLKYGLRVKLPNCVFMGFSLCPEPRQPLRQSPFYGTYLRSTDCQFTVSVTMVRSFVVKNLHTS